MNSMLILRYYGLEKLYEEIWYQKWAKITFMGKITKGVPVPIQGCTGTAQQKPTCTDIGSSCTGTTQQNAIGTGNDPSCTGTDVSKMPRML